MARVIFTTAADVDAAFVFEDLYKKAGKATVIKYRAAFKALYEHLAEFPDSGAPRPKIGQKIRIGIVYPYIVIYRHYEGEGIVRILRIVYGSRKITGKLLRGVS